jgi:hypothetical protein
MRVIVKYTDGAQLEGIIKKVAGGFFSVLAEADFTSSIEGGSIFLSD